MKYRKKPVVIEAIMYSGDNYTEIEKFVGKIYACGGGRDIEIPITIIYTDFIMKNLHETLGSLIRRRRKELKMTAEELAIKVQVDRTYLSKMERHNFIPSLEVLMRLNAVLDLNTFIINDPAIRNKIKFPPLEGIMRATIGDMIIKGVKGEFYPCKPDIFEATYEQVE